MTKEELAAKIDWEGGVESAINYGIKVTDLPEDTPARVVHAWAILQAAREDLDLINAWLWS